MTLLGRRAELLEQAPKLVVGAIEAIEEFTLQVPRGSPGHPGGTSKQLAATPLLRARLRGPMAAMGMAVSDVGTYLGVDVVLSKRGHRQRATARDRMLVWRMRRIRQMRTEGKNMRVGTRMVFKQGLKPARTFGMRCLGMPPARLRQLRTKTLSAMQGVGTHRSVQLAVMGQEPTMEANAAPVTAWAEAHWDAAVPRRILERAWRSTLARLGQGGTWAKVKGLAAATWMSCRRIGWGWPAYSCFSSREGLLIRLDGTCPLDVKAVLLRDGERALLARLVQAA